MPSVVTQLIGRAVELRDGELRALLLGFGYFFCLLCSYYILRPLRDEMALQVGYEHFQLLFTGTFFAMLLALPLYGWLVGHFPKRRIVPIANLFFVANIIGFWLLLLINPEGAARKYVAGGFFIWVSVYNLFVVSIFWSLLADLFREEQGKRLFGFIAAGGTAGALLGPMITIQLAEPLGPVHLLLISTAFLLLATYFASAMGRSAAEFNKDSAKTKDQVIGGNPFAGAIETMRSPFLLMIALYILLLTATNTVLYFQQGEIVSKAFTDSAERTRFFATIDLIVSLLTIGIQIFGTGRILTKLGLGFALVALPVITLFGFAALMVSPVLGIVVAVQSIRRASDFALAIPARGVLFTTVDEEAKYKARNFLDTVVFRGGDAAFGWVYHGFKATGLDLTSIAAICLPISALWAFGGHRLGKAHQKRVESNGK
ncbi:MAG: MFS transporter [Rhodospirillaceae bacterium]|nr:MFS transporter [Rhodospirillaceae bacterium]HAA92526.1 MFS transporter [Rhodospirillaceae bacterium]